MTPRMPRLLTPSASRISIAALVGKGELAELAGRLRAFARERDWEQFHNAKNLAASVSVEAAELLEVFQWLTREQAASLGDEAREQAQAEIADVLIYLVLLADVLNVDVAEAVDQKIQLNHLRYPPDSVRGRANWHPNK